MVAYDVRRLSRLDAFSMRILRNLARWMLICGCGLALPTVLAAGKSPVDGGASKKPAVAKAVANATHRFEIRGMFCEGCAKGITGEVRILPGVAAVTVSYPKKLAVVACDTNRVSQAELVKVIREAGYEAVPLPGRKEPRR